MELTLARKSQTGTRVKGCQRCSLNVFDVFQTRPDYGPEFFVQRVYRFTWRNKQEAIQPFEFAVNGLLPNNPFDFVDRDGMTLGDNARPFFLMKPLNFAITIVDRVAEMSRRPLSLTCCYLFGIHNYNGFSPSR